MTATEQYLWNRGSLQTPDSELRDKVKGASWIGNNPWASSGQQPGIKVWRICDSRLSPWPAEENGCFFDQDVYILLHNYFPDVMSQDLSHNIHIWVGKQASLEDYNITVLLVPWLRKVLASQGLVYREVSGRESAVFKDYFKTIMVSSGKSCDSYRYNPDEACPARLFRYYKPDSRSSHYRFKEVAPLKSNLQPEHMYLMDIGRKLYLWTGHIVTAKEKLKAMEYCENLCARRGTATSLEILDELTSEDHYFNCYLQTRNDGSLIDSDDETAANVTRQATLKKKAQEILAYRIIAKGKDIQFKKIKASRKELQGQDICVIDAGNACFVWLGRKSTTTDKHLSLHYAHEYLQRSRHPFVPVTVVPEGTSCSAFKKAVPS